MDKFGFDEEKLSIKDICTYAPKSSVKAGDAVSDGEYIFFTSSDDESKRLGEYQLDGEAIIMGTGGNATLHYYHGKFAVSTDCVVLLPKDEIKCKYLYYFFKSNMRILEAGFKGAGLKHTNKGYIGDIVFGKIPLQEKQDEVIYVLDKVHSIINARKEELLYLDTLIKARFVEMFGDAFHNEKEWIKAPMGDYMTLLTDFSANGSYKTLDSNVVMYDEPNYAWMVRTTDLESGDVESRKYIDQKAYELLSKSKLFGDEIIMNKIGSAGKIYLMPKTNKPASLGRNAFMFRFDDRINIKYLFYHLNSEYGQREIQQYVRGAVTKTITKDDARAVQIMVPPIELQNQFIDFVIQVDKLKVEVQKSLDESQTLFDSLMQQYFG